MMQNSRDTDKVLCFGWNFRKTKKKSCDNIFLRKFLTRKRAEPELKLPKLREQLHSVLKAIEAFDINGELGQQATITDYDAFIARALTRAAQHDNMDTTD